MRLLHAADIHLGASYAGFGDLADARAREVLEAFRAIPDIAAQERIDAVLFAGDLFDGPQPPPETLAAARDTLRRLVDLCIPVFLVPGNHDSTTLKLNPYRDLARGSRVVVQDGDSAEDDAWPVGDEQGRRLAEKHRAYILARPRFGEPVSIDTDSGPLHVYGVAYDAAECADPLPTFQRHSAPGVHVALFHAAVRNGDHWTNSGNSLVATPDELNALEVDYIALGDYHRPRLPDEFPGGRACYPGSFAATDLTETGVRGFVIATVDAGRGPSVDYRDAGVRPAAAVELDVSALEDDIQVAEAAARAVSARAVPSVRLVGEPSFPLDADRIAAELNERFGHAAVYDETRYYASSRLDELAELDTVVGHVVRLGRTRIEDAVGTQRMVAQRALRVALRALGVD
jgi:exonuclease SbcD